MDQLAAMRAFVRVVEAGTFTRAADLMAIPKPTLTKHVQTLEAHLRTKLLNRTTRRVTVTPDGAAYYERALALLNDLDELDNSMARSQASPRGRLRVDISTALAILVLIPALPDFFALYPDIRIDLGVTDRAVDMVGENVDCVVRGGELIDPSLVARRVAEIQMITCAAPSYIARYGVPEHPRDLEVSFPAVRYFSARTGRLMPLEFAKDGETVEVEGRYSLAVNEGNAYIEAALSGLGLLQAPTFMVQTHIASGALVPVLSAWETETFPLFVVYPPNRHLSTRLRVFVDWVAALFANHDLIQRRSTLARGEGGAR
ncbi:LysR family transcriptional regulator [Aquabacter spiritensis]|uniref:LysR family transcriptional regulator n=1 Tax=Aquabacter spiritensis TaxID=933073 RepID=A0A4R3LTP4_9HYPH|nr:LysR family transcriptional regulator [Aquabacter spiritensis]TCT03940.1 LysR family transcriptional regulator [Aquabacter spiritensis]